MAFLVLLIPVAVMAFALLMERLEHHLQNTTMSEQDVEEFLDQAQPDEVNTFIREGWSRALSMFRVRSRRNRPSRRSRGLAARPSTSSPTADVPSPESESVRSDATPRSARHE